MKKFKLKKTRIFGLLFLIMFICSLFTSISVLAQTDPFKLSNVSVVNKSITVNGDVTDYDNDEVESDITFHSLNDFVTYKLVINNNLDKDVTIIGISDDSNSDYIIYDYDKHENNVVAGNNSFDFLVTATYKNEITDMSKRVEDSKIKFTIKYLVDGEEDESNISINPNTGDKSYIHFVILFISSIGLTVCVVLDKKYNKKLVKVVVLSLLVTPIVVTAGTFTYDIELNTSCKLYDKQMVTYTDGNGDKQTIVVPYNELISRLENPSKDGYNFDKWVLEDGSDFDASSPITEDIKLTPKFNAISYDIDYDLNGGTTSTNNPTFYTIEDKITLVNPTKNHYDFVGWEGTGLDEVTKNVVISNGTGDRSYTAVYTPKNYTISYSGLTDEETAILKNKTEYSIETSEFNLTNPSDRLDSDGDALEKFVGWKEGSTTSNTVTLPNINSMGNKTFEAIWVDADPSVYTITYELHDGVVDSPNKDSFTKKTETFTLNNPHKAGYTFKGWSGTDLDGDNNLEVSVSKGTRKNLEFEANYTPNTYQIKFNKNGENVEGTMSNQIITYDVETNISDILYTKEGYTFTGWNTNADGSGSGYSNKDKVKNLLTEGTLTLYAQWSANSYTVSFDANNPTGTTVNGSMDSISAKYDEEKTLPTNMFSIDKYTFTGWNTKADGSGDSIDNGSKVKNLVTSGTATLYAQWDIIKYTISFDSNGGSDVDSKTVTIDSPVGVLDVPEKDGYIFDGWYIDLDDDNAIDETYVPDDDILLYAKWKSFVCRKATVIHSEKCLNTSDSQGCRGARYTAGEDIIYGNAVSSDILKAGDALDCDVNNEGYTKRFYYLRTIEDRAVLIANINYEGSNDGTTENYIYSEAMTKLPTPEQWSNLPITFTIEDGSVRAGRFITFDDLYAVSGKDNLLTTGVFDEHEYLFENTTFANVNGRSTYWLKPDSVDGPYYRVHKKNRNVESGGTDTKNAVRPVIEVPLNLIEDKYIIRFNPNGGSIDNEYVRITKGSKLGSIPTPVREDYTFIGWFTSNDESISEDTIPNGYETYTAKWIYPVTDAAIEKTNYSIEIDNSDNIIITNSDILEPYQFSSDNENIATVNSNGVITAVGVGTTNIKITGLNTNKVRNIKVNVVDEITEFTVSFDSNGGSDVSEIIVSKNTAVGTLPTPTKTDYDFDGWYTSNSYIEAVSESTIISDNVTFYAKWIPAGSVAVVGDKYYKSVQSAIDETKDTTFTVKLIKDVEITSYIDLNSKNLSKSVTVDLNNHSITNNNNNVFKTKTYLEVKNGTLYCGSDNAGAIDVAADGKFVMNSGRIEATGSRQAIYNNGGIVEIGGSVYLKAKADGSNNAKRATVQNASGTTTITGGTIEGYGDTNSYAVSVNGGKLYVGTNDGVYDTESIKIFANTTGIYSTVNFSLYDGMISGKNSAVSNESKINSVEDNSTKVNDEVDLFKRLYYSIS